MRAHRLALAAFAVVGAASYSLAAIPHVTGTGGNGGNPGGGAESAVYSIDDGTADDAVGFGTASTTPNDLLWMNTFPKIAGAEKITTISIAYGTPSFPGSATNGTPVRILLYNDPDGGSPQNAQLLVNVPGVVAGATTNTFVTYDIPDTVINSGFLAVGVLMPNTLGATNPYPCALDTAPPAETQRSFIAFGAGGTVDPANLQALPSGQFLAEESIAPGNWLVRANGDPAGGVPEPASLGLLGAGALTLFARRRRA